MNIKLVEHLQTLNEEDLFPNATPQDVAGRKVKAEEVRRGQLISEIHEWVHLDVSEEQIKAVLWAIAMSNTKREVIGYLQDLQTELESERIKADELGED